jgi:hypothetical protein
MRRTKADGDGGVGSPSQICFEFLARKKEDWTLISTTAEITMMPSDSAPETMRNARLVFRARHSTFDRSLKP